MSDSVVQLTDDNFEEEVLKSELPVLVDFWAQWCGPCKMIAPILDELATEYAGKVKIGKLNIDENQATAPQYGVRGIPTLILVKDGAVQAQQVGAVSKSQLTTFLNDNT
jgi:thioredoxin 1